MIYAVYRVLYGEDFIQASIRSISPFVDRIFVFWDDRPWGDVTEVVYKGQRVVFPRQFDHVVDRVKALQDPKVELIYDHMENNVGQFAHLVNDHILSRFPRPDIAMFIEPDHVFRKAEIEVALQSFLRCGYSVASTSQVELWRTFQYQIPKRQRYSVVMWNMGIYKKIPPCGRHADVGSMKFLDARVHNLGFCFSPQVMYWKHLIAIAMSQKIGDSIPNEDWYEKTWLGWDYKSNNRNLEISKGYEMLIPFAFPYDEPLPEVLM
jgi:hypothetical protein